MPIDVRMPDGTLVTDVPDNITQADLMARFDAFKAQPVTSAPTVAPEIQVTPQAPQVGPEGAPIPPVLQTQPKEEMSASKAAKATAEEVGSIARRLIADPALGLAKGVINAEEFLVGLGDILTGGRAGKSQEETMKERGMPSPQQMKDFLTSLQSPERIESVKKVAEAKGFGPTALSLIENPSALSEIVESSLPSMAASQVGLGRYLLPKVAPKMGAVSRGAVGEATVQAGSMAEQVRQQNEDRLLTPKQSAMSVVSGVLTGAQGLLGGKVAQKLGLQDVDTLLAGGVSADVKRNILTTAFKSALAESAFEEMPQSVQEQISQNIALGRPPLEGVAEAGAAGALAGFATAGGITGVSQFQQNRRIAKEGQPTPPAVSERIEPEVTPIRPRPEDIATPPPIEPITEPTKVDTSHDTQAMLDELAGKDIEYVPEEEDKVAEPKPRETIKEFIDRATPEELEDFRQKNAALDMSDEGRRLRAEKEQQSALDEANKILTVLEANKSLAPVQYVQLTEDLKNGDIKSLRDLKDYRKIYDIITKKQAEPEVLYSAPMGENTEYHVLKNDQGHVANLYDKDAGRYVPDSARIFPVETFGEQTEIAAKNFVDEEQNKAAAYDPSIKEEPTGVITEEDKEFTPVGGRLINKADAARLARESAIALEQNLKNQEIQRDKQIRREIREDKFPAAKTPSLASALKALGGIKQSNKLDMIGDTGKVFNYESAFSEDGEDLLTHIENGDLDQYLPHQIRLSNTPENEPFDPRPGYEYISKVIESKQKAYDYDYELAKIDHENKIREKYLAKEYMDPNEEAQAAAAEVQGKEYMNVEIPIPKVTEQELLAQFSAQAQEYISEMPIFESAKETKSFKIEMNKLRRAIKKGMVSEADVIPAIDQIYESTQKDYEPSERIRGAEIIKEKLLAAKRRKELSPEIVDMALFLIDKNPALVKDLAVSITASKRDGRAGGYAPLARLATIFKYTPNNETAVHEILHHLERMMPKDIQAAIRKAWSRSLSTSAARAFGGTNETLKQYYRDVIDYHTNGDEKAEKRAMSLLAANTVGYDHYQNFNPSEFWAINGSNIVQNRYNADISESMVERIKNWLLEFVEKVKALFNLQSDAAVIRALNSVAKGDGKFITDMIYENEEALNLDRSIEHEFSMEDLPSRTNQMYTIPAGTELFHGAHETRANEILQSGSILKSKRNITSGGGLLTEGNLLWFGDKDMATRHARSEIDVMKAEWDREKGVVRNPGKVFVTISNKPLRLVGKNFKMTEKQAIKLNRALGLPKYKSLHKGDSLDLASYRAHEYQRSNVERYKTESGERSAPWPIILKELGFDGYYDMSGVALNLDEIQASKVLEATEENLANIERKSDKNVPEGLHPYVWDKFKKMLAAEAKASNYNYGSAKRETTMSARRYLQSLDKYHPNEDPLKIDQKYQYEYGKLTDPEYMEKYGQYAFPELYAADQAKIKSSEKLDESTTDTPEFKKWFAGSEVVDKKGKPLKVYHGTLEPNIQEFKPEFVGRTGFPDTQVGEAYFFSNQQLTAEMVAETVGHDRNGHAIYSDQRSTVMPVYLFMENPLIFKAKKYSEEDKIDSYRMAEMIKRAKALKRDGVIYKTPSMGDTYVVFKPEQIKSVYNKGAFERANKNIYANIQRPPRNFRGQEVLPQWHGPEESKIDNWIYNLQNKQIDTKRVQEAIGDIEENWNVYEKEQLYHGRTASGIRNFLLKELLPVIKEIERLKISPEDIRAYLHNRHAEERNIQMNKINPDIYDPKTGRTTPNPLKDKGSGISTADAQAYLNNLDPAKKQVFEQIATKFDEMVKGTQQILINSGNESAETIAKWNKTYKHYVPLFRVEDEMARPSGMGGTGQGFGTRGNFSKRAMGSEKDVQDILSNIIAQRERALIRAEKTRVGRALYGMAIQNANPDFWLPINPDAIRNKKQAIAELTRMGIPDAENVVNNLMAEPKERYLRKINVAEGAVEPDEDFDFDSGLPVNESKEVVASKINVMARYKDFVFPVRINGKDRYIFFNKNDPRALRMVQSLKNLDVENLGLALSIAGKFTRWFKNVNTQYNPVFGLVNFVRDFSGALLNLTSTEIKGEQAKVIAGAYKAMGGILNVHRAERKGKPLPTGPWARLYQEARAEGFQTGYRDSLIRNQEEMQIVENTLNQFKDGNTKKAFYAVIGGLTDFNDMMENAIRLSAYKVALDKGLSKQKAAIIAKNLTVNFDKKGAKTAQVNALYAFFNASVQGTERIYQTIKGPKGKMIIGGGILAGMVQAVMLAGAGYDDDDPPEFVREKNFIIPLVDGTYLTVPYPLGYNVLPNSGRIVMDFMLHGGRNPGKHAVNFLSSVVNSFNPLGSTGFSMQTIMPTVLDPLAALSENKDAFGRPISRKDRATAPTPGYTRSRETSTKISQGLAYFLNLASGGSKYQKGYISPTADELDFLAGQIGGGLYREVTKAGKAVSSVFTGEEIPTYQRPVVGRFVGATGSQASVAQSFYNNVTRMTDHENEIKGRMKNREDVEDYLKDYPEARLWKRANSVENKINELNKRKRLFVERGFPKERIQAIDAQKSMMMKRFNDQVKNLRPD